MNKKLLIVLSVVVVLLALIVGVLAVLFVTKNKGEEEDKSTDENVAADDQQGEILEEDVVYKKDSTTVPNWVKSMDNGKKGPWESPIYIAFSQDGLTFTDEKLFIDHAGVANVIMTDDGELIATFQYFSYTNEEMFDVIAYTVSEDYGQTWSVVKKLRFSGFNNNFGDLAGPKPVDPTLVQLEDGTFRLYFTYEQEGDGFPQLYSAKAGSIDGTFANEGKQLTTQEIILDPAAIYFKGEWHHYTVIQEQGASAEGFIDNVHSTSDTGLNFTRQDDISLKMSMLGCVIEDDGELVFYGSGEGIKSARSNDGYAWTMESGNRIDGADPGVAKLADATYVMIYTKMN